MELLNDSKGNCNSTELTQAGRQCPLVVQVCISKEPHNIFTSPILQVQLKQDLESSFDSADF